MQEKKNKGLAQHVFFFFDDLIEKGHGIIFMHA
jgi:hypothetical protein